MRHASCKLACVRNQRSCQCISASDIPVASYSCDSARRRNRRDRRAGNLQGRHCPARTIVDTLAPQSTYAAFPSPVTLACADAFVRPTAKLPITRIPVHCVLQSARCGIRVCSERTFEAIVQKVQTSPYGYRTFSQEGISLKLKVKQQLFQSARYVCRAEEYR